MEFYKYEDHCGTQSFPFLFCQDPFMTQGSGFSSDVADQSFLFDQALPLNQGFMPSPPYSNHTNSTASPPYANFSPSCSKSTPSPQSSCEYQTHCDDSTFSPYSSSVATPICDPMLPSSTPFQPHVSVQSVNQYANQQATPTTRGMFAYGMMGLPPNGPGKSIEVQATFIPNGNSTSNLTGYSESFSLPMRADLTDVFGLNGPGFAQKPSLTHAPPHIRQNVIHNARQRYSGAAPASGHPSSGGGVAMGHVTDGADADSSISQWSQWLKGSAPAPVC